jgi:peptide/nickel transport system substrate-binding protein
MAMTLFIMPKMYREKLGPQEYSQHPIAAGPYKITRLNTAAEVDMERYDGYYVDSPKGKPAIGKIIIRWYLIPPPRWPNYWAGEPTGSGSSAPISSMP